MSSIMTSNNNNNNNNDDGASSHFDKTDFCRENGLAVPQKKDGKSRNRREKDQILERQKKIEDNMQKLDPVIAKPTVKPVVKPVFKDNTFLGQNAQTSLLAKEYDEDLLIDNDVRDEVLISKQLVLDDIHFNELRECGYFDDRDPLFEANLRSKAATATVEDTEYMENLSVWLRFGLTKQQYDANIEYKQNCEMFNRYLDDCDEDDGEDPVFIQELQAKIIAYQDAVDAKQRADAQSDDENDWWMDEAEAVRSKMASNYAHWTEAQEDPDQFLVSEEEEYDNDYSMEDWIEDYKEQLIEYARQDAIDDSI